MTIRYYLTCIFLFATCITKAQQCRGINQQGDSLFLAGRFFEASIEYERGLFTCSDSISLMHSIEGKIQCLKQQQLFPDLVKFIQANRGERFSDSFNYHLYYEQILAAYMGADFETVLGLTEQARLNYRMISDDLFIDMIRIMSLNELRRWPEAAMAYKAFRTRAGLDSSQATYARIPHLKSVDKASWLSTFIPGGGQFYAGKPLEGLLSILIQAAGVYYGVVSFQEKYYLSAWLVGAGIFGSFHMGSVRRSEYLVNQYNARKAYQFNQQVKEDLIKIADNKKGLNR